MGFSSEYWHSFHYSDSRGYLIFCCHGVAKEKANQSPLTLVKSSFNAQSEISISGSNIKDFKCMLSGVIRFTSSIIAFCSDVKNGSACLYHSLV